MGEGVDAPGEVGAGWEGEGDVELRGERRDGTVSSERRRAGQGGGKGRTARSSNSTLRVAGSTLRMKMERTTSESVWYLRSGCGVSWAGGEVGRGRGGRCEPLVARCGPHWRLG